MIQASWNGHTFEISNKVLKGLESITLPRALKFEQQETLGGKDKINKKGFEQETISINYTPALVAGADPRTEFESWGKDLGAKAKIYIAGKAWSDSNFILTKINLSSSMIDNNGRIHVASLSLEFKEDYNFKDSSEKKAETKTSAVDVGPSKAEKKKIVKGG